MQICTVTHPTLLWYHSNWALDTVMANQMHPPELHEALPQKLPFSFNYSLLVVVFSSFFLSSTANVFHFDRLKEFWKQYCGTAVEAPLPLDHMWFCLKTWAVWSHPSARAHFDPGDFLLHWKERHFWKRNNFIFHQKKMGGKSKHEEKRLLVLLNWMIERVVGSRWLNVK